MSYELIITEKPAAALKIANALADKDAKAEKKGKVSSYRLKHKGKDIMVACAVGHLYALAEKEKKGWVYPVFSVEWKPAADVNKSATFSKAYMQVIKSLAKDADSFTIATDYDIEGEVIGLNVLKYACKQKDASRMKFSTLTKPDLVASYANKSPTIDWGQANAGLTRHELDWYYGINLSRALTASIKAAGRFKLMSSGRVQGPALKILVEREKEIQAFKSEPYWQIELNGNVKNGAVQAWHIKNKFWEKKEADAVIRKTKGKPANVKDIKKRQFNQSPPEPFDLTTLQIESYRCFRISPKETLAIAQGLYIAGLISYPRTSSQKLPPAIGYKKILEKISKQANYTKLVKKLLSKKALKPNEGKKTDSAHPAIYPTGIAADVAEGKQKVYDLIVKRFMATFSEPAKKQTMNIEIDCNSEIFIAKGTTTLEPGWYEFYAPYVKVDELELPVAEKDEDVKVKSIKKHSKETQPPKRYTPASIIKELEKKNLGTKSTRAQVVDTLFHRGYVDGRTITPTELGIHTIRTLDKYSPGILDEKLTRHFEQQMEDIRENKKKSKDVLEEAKKVLIKILGTFKKKEKDIGKSLVDAHMETQQKQNTIGKCPNCSKGNLVRKRGKFGSFLACDQYPKCKTTFNFPDGVNFKADGKLCEHCNHPVIMIFKKGRKPQQVCINPDCKDKAVEEEKETKNCPKCKATLVLRKSIYGQFYGCSNYPKCRYTEKIKKEEEGDHLL